MRGRVTYTTFTGETGVHLSFETEHHRSFPEHHGSFPKPKRNSSNAELVRQVSQTAFVRRLEPRRESLSASGLDVKGLAARWGRLSASAGYLVRLDTTGRAHDHTAACEEPEVAAMGRIIYFSGFEHCWKHLCKDTAKQKYT